MILPDGQSAGSAALYDEGFYEDQMDLSYRSAVLYSKHLWDLFQPQSVIDFGCGRGTWLKAFAELGVERLVGYDGPWNSQAAMADQRIEFRPADLNEAVLSGVTDERFDLAMTVEVVEHLRPENSEAIVAALGRISDVVMFGAAFLGQPGVDHINTRLHSFWAQIFEREGFRVYDYFRPAMWGRPGLPWWYQQNTFLYVKRGHPVEGRLAERGHAPVENLQLLDFVHPRLLDLYIAEVNRQPRTFGAKLKWLVRDMAQSIRPNR